MNQPASIRRSMMRVVFITTLAALLVNAVALISLDIHDYRDKELEATRIQADMLARASAAAVAFDDRDEATNAMRMVERILRPFRKDFRHSRAIVRCAYSEARSCVKPVHFIARMSMVRWIYADAVFIARLQASRAKKPASMCKGIGHIRSDCSSNFP